MKNSLAVLPVIVKKHRSVLVVRRNIVATSVSRMAIPQVWITSSVYIFFRSCEFLSLVKNWLHSDQHCVSVLML